MASREFEEVMDWWDEGSLKRVLVLVHLIRRR